MKKTFALVLALCMLLSIMAGCGTDAVSAGESTQSSGASQKEESTAMSVAEQPGEPGQSATEPSDADPAAEATSEVTAPEGTPSLTYPMVTDGSQTVTMWVSLPPHVSPYMENVSESAAYRAAVEATGIGFDTTTVSTQVQDEQLQLMCAAGTTGDYDIIVGASTFYGSADGAVEDEILLDVKDYLEELMPDFYNFLQNDVEIRKLLTTDNGAIVDIAGRGTGGRAQGYGIRKDWLDKSGLEIPTTYDELHQVLTVFKNDYDCAQPLLMFSTGFLDNDYLCAGLGVTQSGYYVDEGQVKFCYTEEGFREYCKMINQWYTEGLMSRDFLNNTQGAGISYDAQMLDGTAGVFMTGVDIFSSSSKASAADPDWNAVPMADVTRTGNEVLPFGMTPNADPLSNKWNITTGVTEERLPYVLGFVNWFFTEDGTIACNFGIEGEGFEYDENGDPRLTELVTNNPDGLQSFMSEAIYLNWNAPYSIDTRYYDSIYDTEAQAEASDIWNSNRSTEQKYYGDLTSEENSDYSALYSDIETYITTMTVSFMTGAEDIDAQWDTFVSTIESMDIASCIEIKQAAYERYVQR